MSSPLTNAYTPNVPLGTQQINNTQQPIQYNFSDIAQLLAVNHVPFNTADIFGNHTVIDCVTQRSDPSTESNEIALYSKNVTSDTNTPELFYRYPNNGNIVQLTGNITSSETITGPSGYMYTSQSSIYQPIANGYYMQYYGFQYLPGGSLMKWGILWAVPTTQSGTAIFNFPIPPSGTVAMPTFNVTPFHFEFSANYPTGYYGQSLPYGEIQLSPVSTTQFSVQYNQQPYPGGGYYGFGISWMCIGA